MHGYGARHSVQGESDSDSDGDVLPMRASASASSKVAVALPSGPWQRPLPAPIGPALVGWRVCGLFTTPHEEWYEGVIVSCVDPQLCVFYPVD